MFELAQVLQYYKTSDSNKLYKVLVQKEALIICHHRVFASFLCVLSLSSVLGRFIELCYPDNSGKFKNMFSRFLFKEQVFFLRSSSYFMVYHY